MLYLYACLPSGVLGLVFGHLNIREVMSRCWLVCKPWKVRMQAPSLNVRVRTTGELRAVEARSVTTLTTLISVDADELSQLTNVTSLDLVDSYPRGLLNRIEEFWPGLKKLRASLVFQRSPERIWVFPELEELDLSKTNLEDLDLSALASMPRLTKLNLCETGLLDEEARVLSRLRSLTSLSIGKNALTDETVSGLPTGLRELSLTRLMLITDESVETLACLELESLDLSGTQLKKPALHTLSKLKRLDLSSCRLDVLSLPDSLEHLNLDSGRLWAGFRDTPNLWSLKTLNLAGCVLSWEALAARAPNVECVSIHGSRDVDRDRARRCFPRARVKLL
jgi:hypothetical protein